VYSGDESGDHNPHLELAEHKGKLDSIVSGVYVHPSAPAIFRAKEFNKLVCIMLDTTWTVIRQYVTSILVAVSRNTAIALAFAFGPAETVDQYNLIFIAFSRYSIDLSTFILESDQGSSLTLFAKTHDVTQRFCLHHFLYTICTGTFSWGIANAVRTRTIIERDRLLSELTFLIRQFYSMLTDQTLATLGKDLKRRDLGFETGLFASLINGGGNRLRPLRG
jgi:hypothetical protein